MNPFAPMDTKERDRRIAASRAALETVSSDTNLEELLEQVERELSELADHGDVEACEILGSWLGTVAPHRVEKAIQLLTFAAGSGVAAHNLGTVLFSIDKQRSKEAYARAYELGFEQRVCSDPLWWKGANSG